MHGSMEPGIGADSLHNTHGSFLDGVSTDAAEETPQSDIGGSRFTDTVTLSHLPNTWREQAPSISALIPGI